MYATTVMPYRRRLAAHPRRWWLRLLFILSSLCAGMAPGALSIQLAAPTYSELPVSALKAMRPLSPRLAMLAQGGTPEDRTATTRALSLPQAGPGSLLTDVAGDPLVYIQLKRIDQ